MAGLGQAIHVFVWLGTNGKTRMPGTRPGMTVQFDATPLYSRHREAISIRMESDKWSSRRKTIRFF